MRATFPGPRVSNSDYIGSCASAAMQSGVADAIAFGRPFISNPDLPRRLAENIPPSPPTGWPLEAAWRSAPERD